MRTVLSVTKLLVVPNQNVMFLLRAFCTKIATKPTKEKKGGNVKKRKAPEPKPGFDTHHIIPQSRCDELSVEKDDPSNIRYKEVQTHNKFHQLFGNRCPWEIIKWLELLKEVFGDKTTSQMIEEVRREWS